MQAVEVDIQEVTKQAAELIAIMSLPDAMWTVENCAQYLGTSKRYFAERVCKHPGFPPPIEFPCDVCEKRKRAVLKWVAQDIKDWALSCRKN